MKGTSQPKTQLFGLVRDKDGKPKIDDLDNIPKPIWDMLTREEQEEISHGRNSHSSNS